MYIYMKLIDRIYIYMINQFHTWNWFKPRIKTERYSVQYFYIFFLLDDPLQGYEVYDAKSILEISTTIVDAVN